MSDTADKPLISFDALRRSHRVIVNLHAFYFRLYNLDSGFLVRNYPVLVYTEAFVYELDQLTEQAQDTGKQAGEVGALCAQVRETLIAQEAWDAWTEAELNNLVAYFQRESEIVLSGSCTPQNLVSTNKLRSSDVRLLHRMTCKLAAISYDEEIFRALSPMEELFEIEDDIRSYGEDVQNNRFNTLALLKRFDGRSAPGKLAEMTNALEAEFHERAGRVSSPRRTVLMSLYDLFRTKFPRPAPVTCEGL